MVGGSTTTHLWQCSLLLALMHLLIPCTGQECPVPSGLIIGISVLSMRYQVLAWVCGAVELCDGLGACT